MNIGFYACLILGLIFAVITILFTLLGDKAAVLISGFNLLTQEQRKQYDIRRLSSDQRNSMLIWTIIMLMGALFSFILSQYIAIIAFIIWLIIFFNDVHMDTVKAFEKYKTK
ncbi:DUF3784 domain-containing protein [Anaerocolumna sp. MB42-C2]|uniref:DUF3784 domain-containing protein n=1 Tax=Anaerocolumna sp. MB42-C2 TaxID=3070997 RepID=UPI0027E1F6E9|nr:DUF3784 domain-containing protein [Anaerocolumna sp. MB42-C2]WMJ86027.1 DUF3784 domain-containing protein [Anaerocolumna sp. MB42-C2]